MKMNEYMERTEQVVLHTYNRFPVVFEKGEGVHLYDTEGKEYLDFGAGIAVFALGYHYADYDQALKDPDGNYGYLIEELGARILQTDRPGFMLDYLRKKGLHD